MASQGFTISIPRPVKSLTLRVTMPTMSLTIAVPAIKRSMSQVNGRNELQLPESGQTTLRFHDRQKGYDPYSPRESAICSQRVVPDVGREEQAAIRIPVHGLRGMKAIGQSAGTRNGSRRESGNPLWSQTRHLCPGEIRSFDDVFVFFRILEGNLSMGHSAAFRDFKIGSSRHVLH